MNAFLSIVIPAHEEAEGLARAVAEIRGAAEDHVAEGHVEAITLRGRAPGVDRERQTRAAHRDRRGGRDKRPDLQTVLEVKIAVDGDVVTETHEIDERQRPALGEHCDGCGRRRRRPTAERRLRRGAQRWVLRKSQAVVGDCPTF